MGSSLPATQIPLVSTEAFKGGDSYLWVVRSGLHVGMVALLLLLAALFSEDDPLGPGLHRLTGEDTRSYWV